MKEYKIKVLEKVSVWAEEYITVEAKNMSEVQKMISNGDINRHAINNEAGEFLLETVEHLEYDTSSAVIL